MSRNGIRKIMLIGWMVLCMGVAGNAKSTLDSLLTVYDSEVAQSEQYIHAHAARIDSLKSIRPMTKALQIRIAREYQYFQSDSARVWFMRLTESEEPYRTQAYTGLVQLASSIGKYTDGMVLISEVDVIPDSLRVDWLEAVWRVHHEALAATETPQLQVLLSSAADLYYDSLLRAMDVRSPENTAIRLRRKMLKAMDDQDAQQALVVNDSILSRLVEWSHPYAIEAYNRSTIYEQLGDYRKRLEWLTRSAIADVRCGITDNGSSWLVAKECFMAGDLELAHHFSDYSLTNASFFNAPTRYIQTHALGHQIGMCYEQRLKRYSTTLYLVMVALAIALTAMIVGIFFALRQNRRLHALNNELSSLNSQLSTINAKLKESDMVKEQYICRYLEVYNDYIRRLTTMARKAGEKDPAAFMSYEMDNFYRSFDDTFLSLYGTFVQDFNALLKPEARVMPKPGDRMTIEMRIFALILLGITSSAKIAELLCYSPNTISNYRVKMKNAALGDREAFEDKVREIKYTIHNFKLIS